MSDSKKKILVVEDDQLFAEIYASKFSEEGFVVLLASDGESGLKMVDSERPDIILLDLMLPRVSGLDFLAQLRGHDDNALRNTPVIVLTNLNEHSFSDALKQHGVRAYFLKSDVIISQVVDKIREVLA